MSFPNPLSFIPKNALCKTTFLSIVYMTLISIQTVWAEGGGGGGDLGDGGGSGPEPNQGWMMLFGFVVLMGFGFYARKKKGHQ